MWFGDLVDVRTIPEAGQDLHIRWDPTEIEKPDGKFDGMKRVAMITIVVSLSLMVLITFCCIYWRKRKFRDKYDEGGQEDLDLPLFRFDTIAHATNDFSGDNLLGKGGFGPVYKGTLPDQEIAIISGKRNKGILYPRHGVTLIGHAWRLWKEGVPLEFLDPCLGHSCNPSEVLRCMHIGLLCVQQHPLDRPNMASVVVMLNNESALPQPKEPAFFMERTSAEEQVSSGEKTPYSINEITYTQLEPR
ncbi:hypothetical protein L6164_017839 [Bauhinia variegata]|uniref:Uncharacterized protein n=1 Tax=Bauhinia variegata TaxID=167791 RepID=A0ACB9N959_BAUVA|nr:hypothetical protein L6164_017839 [Bauhinia variegata]